MELGSITPFIEQILPNKYWLKSQLLVIRNLVTTERASTFDHSCSIVLDIKNIINVNIIDIEGWLFIIPKNIQNRITTIYIGSFDKPISII